VRLVRKGSDRQKVVSEGPSDGADPSASAADPGFVSTTAGPAIETSPIPPSGVTVGTTPAAGTTAADAATAPASTHTKHAARSSDRPIVSDSGRMVRLTDMQARARVKYPSKREYLTVTVRDGTPGPTTAARRGRKPGERPATGRPIAGGNDRSSGGKRKQRPIMAYTIALV
jgi:hypothetical protein